MNYISNLTNKFDVTSTFKKISDSCVRVNVCVKQEFVVTNVSVNTGLPFVEIYKKV